MTSSVAMLYLSAGYRPSTWHASSCASIVVVPPPSAMRSNRRTSSPVSPSVSRTTSACATARPERRAPLRGRRPRSRRDAGTPAGRASRMYRSCARATGIVIIARATLSPGLRRGLARCGTSRSPVTSAYTSRNRTDDQSSTAMAVGSAGSVVAGGHHLDVADRVGADREEQRELVVCGRLHRALQCAEPSSFGEEPGEERGNRAGRAAPHRFFGTRERGRDRRRCGLARYSRSYSKRTEACSRVRRPASRPLL